MVDLHSHVLAGLDDGPGSHSGSVGLARAAAEAGTSVLAATPHVRADHPFDLTRMPTAVEDLNRRLSDGGIPVEIVPGAEVAITSLVRLSDAELHRLTLGGGPSLLVESPYSYTGRLLERVLAEARERGVQPVLAHPERSPCFLGDLDRLARLVDDGVLCSVTAGSMAGAFGGVVQTFTVRLFERGLVHDVASDAHDTIRRPPGLLAGFERLEPELPGILDQADWFTRAAPHSILAGDPLPARPRAATPERGRVRRLARAVRRRAVEPR